jgi:co-chaperonin GroES (HSP10)
VASSCRTLRRRSLRREGAGCRRRQDREDSGKRPPLDVSEGDEVLYSKYGGTEIEVDGKDLLVLRESDVLAKVQS